MLKLNSEELSEIVNGDIDDPSVLLEERLLHIRKRYEINDIILTMGEKGSFWASETGQWHQTAKPPDRFIDSVGAGDAFAAVCAAGIITKISIDRIIKTASWFSSQICGIQGALPQNESIYSTLIKNEYAMTIKNKIQLITYPDSLGHNLPELHYVLRKYLSKAIGGVHLLPFYPSSGDRGFAPLTYDAVDPQFGTWEDVEKIGQDFDLTIDFMVNHISRQSDFFQDYIQNGANSEYADMFISFDKLAKNGWVGDKDLEKVYTRKPRLPYQTLERPDGSP